VIPVNSFMTAFSATKCSISPRWTAKYTSPTRAVTAFIDLNEFVDSYIPLGWCRGIKVIDADRIVVGFSRLRQTKLRDKVRWVKAQVRRLSGDADYAESLLSLPTRICCFNLKKRALEWDMPLSEHKMDVVFSVL